LTDILPHAVATNETGRRPTAGGRHLGLSGEGRNNNEAGDPDE